MADIVWGVDFKNVLMDTSGDLDGRKWASERYFSLPEVPESSESIRQLVQVTGHQLYIVALCNTVDAGKFRNWLYQTDFALYTGVGPENWHFCSAAREVVETCRRLGVTHYVSHDLELVGQFIGSNGPTKNLYLLEAGFKELEKYPEFATEPKAQPMTWTELLFRTTANPVHA